jgi:hypothetical protein
MPGFRVKSGVVGAGSVGGQGLTHPAPEGRGNRLRVLPTEHPQAFWQIG